MLSLYKNSFWQAFVVTILIFAIGLVFGITLENWRTSKVDDLYLRSDVNILDVKLQSDIYSKGNYDCDQAISENILFADKTYEEAKLLERYQKASVLKADELALWHQKYDLLRTMLFLNSIEIKKKCNASYHNVVYFYKYRTADFDIIAKNTVYSKLLGELKDEYGNNILLIPIAADMNVSSVRLVMDKYKITKDELPVILIDEKVKVSELTNINDLKKYFSN